MIEPIQPRIISYLVITSLQLLCTSFSPSTKTGWKKWTFAVLCGAYRHDSRQSIHGRRIDSVKSAYSLFNSWQ